MNMTSLNWMRTFAVLLPGALVLGGCAGIGIQDAQAVVEPGHQPDDGGHHGGLSDCVDLLRPARGVASRDRLERRRRGDQFPDHLGLPKLCTPRTERHRPPVAALATSAP